MHGKKAGNTKLTAKKDSEGGFLREADFLDALEEVLSTPCIAGTLSGLLLFVVLGTAAYSQIGKHGPSSFSSLVSLPQSIRTSRKLTIRADMPVASWISKKHLPDAIVVDHKELEEGELYAAGMGFLHRVDTLRDYETDLLQTHGKTMAQWAHGGDVGPYWAVIRPPEQGKKKASLEMRELQLVLHPAGTLMLFYATSNGTLYMHRMHTGFNPGAKEPWRRGSHWTERRTIVEMRNGIHYAVQSPTAFYDEHAKLVRVIYTGFVNSKTYSLYMITSADEGETWTWPELLYGVPGMRCFSSVIRPSDTEYVIPVMKEEPLGSGHKALTVLLSSDHGRSFVAQEMDPSPGVLQTAVVRLQAGDLLAYTAIDGENALRISQSTDGGRTWDASLRTEIPQANIAHYAAYVLRSGRVALLFVNHPPPDPKKMTRTPLSIAISTDTSGKAFAAVRDLELADPTELGGYHGAPGFDYPTIVQGDDGLLHIAYTCKNAAGFSFIKYVIVDEAWVLEGARAALQRGYFRGFSDPTW